LYAYFKEWPKAYERVNWTKLLQIIKGADIEWRERRLISNLCMDQCIKIKVDQGKTRSLKKGRGIRPGCYLSPILFNPYREYITKEVLEGFGDFKTGRQVIHTVK
jgi:hypothetical protein